MSKVDLSALRMEQKAPGKPKRPLGPRIAVVVVVLVVLATAATFLVPLLRPVQEVRTAPVRAAGEAEASRVTTAEAAGWIEPDPFPIVVRPLVAGVLQELPVLEGHEVTANETVVGRLESAALQAAVDRARASLELQQTVLEHREAELKVAESLLEQKADLRLAEATARHELTSVRARLAAKRGEHAAALALLDAARAGLEGQEKLAEAGGTYPVALAKARAAVRKAEADAAAKEQEIAALEAETEQDRVALAIAKEVLKEPRALEGKVVEAGANVAHHRALRDQAKTDLAIAQRELDWATVRSPVTGIVMKLEAAPGAVVGPGGHGIVALYDPQRLQARIDVPLAEVEGVQVGQEVEIRSEVLGKRFAKGVVTRVQRESDLLKNTLQVKVRLVDPDPILRPETLVRARFVAPAKGGEEETGPALFRVPQRAVRDDALCVVDPATGRARRITVEVVGEEDGDAVVKGPLSVTQKVILDEVEDGTRVEAKR